jgi:hypothetical protein
MGEKEDWKQMAWQMIKKGNTLYKQQFGGKSRPRSAK